MHKHALVILAHGFEDIEAVAPIDVLNRLGVHVTVAGLSEGSVRGAYGTTFVPHCMLSEVSGDFDAAILPGGKVNATSLASDSRVIRLVQDQFKRAKIVAAICASPSHVLAEGAEVVKGKRVTGDPAFNDRLERCGGIVIRDPVVTDGSLITAQGPGAALAFGLAIGRRLADSRKADELMQRWGIETLE